VSERKGGKEFRKEEERSRWRRRGKRKRKTD